MQLRNLERPARPRAVAVQLMRAIDRAVDRALDQIERVAFRLSALKRDSSWRGALFGVVCVVLILVLIVVVLPD